MKKLLVLIAILAGAIAVIRQLPAEQRASIARVPTAMLNHMPDG